MARISSYPKDGTPELTDSLLVSDELGSITRNLSVNKMVDLHDFQHLVKIPERSGSKGTAGQIKFDNAYIYVCYQTDTWKRIQLQSF